MKKIIFTVLCLMGLVLTSTFTEVKADVDTVPCGNALKNYKKQWFSTNCKYKETYTCLIRCKGPQPPSISL